jgi:uncharacterized protein YbjQ (UPF0145 family)
MTSPYKEPIVDILSFVPFTDSYLAIADGTWTIAMLPGMVGDTLILGLLGWFAAWMWERKHIKSLDAREADLLHVKIEAWQKLPIEADKSSLSNILFGSVVLSHDMFRSLTIFITKLFGGHIKHFERLLDRARREAIIRLKEDALAQGFEKIINLKIITTSIKRNGPKSVEIMVYGTGVAS